jgi:thiol-disulfide isomerase/thioredoxin
VLERPPMRSPRGLIAACYLVALTACSRKSAGPEQVAVTEPSGNAASVDRVALPPSPAPPATTAPAVAASTTAEKLPVLSADALLARVRASGKKGVLVNAWATFCGPCRRELPLLEALAPNLRTSGIDVLLVSMDEPDQAPEAAAFLENLHITLPSVMAERPLGVFKQRMNPRWPGMLPASFLFDAGGTLRYYWGGEAFESEFVPVLTALAEGKPIEGEADFQVARDGVPE